MRFATLGFSHETNTFSRVRATFAKFEEAGIQRGADIVRVYRHSTATLAGYLEAGEQLGIEVVPLVFFQTGPIGTITRDAFDRIANELIAQLSANRPWDGILLAQHGAAVSEEYHDADGEVAARVRALVGPDVPIGLTVDMHANITRRMIDNTTVTVVYRTNPHLDARARARECAEIVARAARGEVRPVQALETPPLVVNILKQGTAEEPMLGVIRDIEAVLQRPGILTASAAEGYPYADVPEMGMAFLAVADDNPQLAGEASGWMATRAWARREEFVGRAPSPAEALTMAAAERAGPVILFDVGDNVGGGSPGDSTYLLQEAQRRGLRAYLQTLCDPAAVQACIAASVGATLTLNVGGKTDDLHGRPVRVTGRVRTISDGQWEDTRPTHGGFRFYDAGPSVVLETTDGHTLVLTSRSVGNTSIQQMYSLGVDPASFKVVVVKGVHSPRPAYEPIAHRLIWVNTPGVTTADLALFSYHRRRVPLFPFERDAVYAPAREASSHA